MKKTAFEKRIKRKITGQVHAFFAACPPGLKNLCADELAQLGLPIEKIAIQAGGIEFQSKPDIAMQANLWLRTPVRILMRIARFKATNFDQLEKKTAVIDWPVILSPSTLQFKASLKSSRLYHSEAVAQRIEAIIRDQWRSNGLFQDQDITHTLFIRAREDQFTLSVDTSGEPLFKRGIKTQVTPAPLRENLAAAMLAWTGFSDSDILMDPMCGSGTFSLEGAFCLTRTPPGRFRSFAFQAMPGFSTKTWQYLYQQAEQHRIGISDKRIFALDREDRAVAALQKNKKGTDFDSMISVEKQDFFQCQPEAITQGRQKGVILINPPYGKRIDPGISKGTSKQSFLKELKHKLKSDFKGWRLGIILPSRSEMALLDLGLKQIPVFHGGIDAIVGVGHL